MTYNPHKLDSINGDASKLMQDFFDDCGGNPQFQLSCFNEETKEAEVVPLEKPYLLVGRSQECELCFKDREVSYRHAYLQLLKERLLVVDLGSRTGTSWKGNRRRSGWLLPGREVKFGPHVVKLVRLNKFDADPLEGESNLALKEVIARGADTDSRSFPYATLELLSVNSKSPTGKTLVLKPGVTLIGRSRVAQIRLKHDSVSHVHSSLVLTENGLWIIDLLGRGGSYVNEEQIEFALLQRDDIITIGAFHLRVETGRAKQLTGNARAQLKTLASSDLSDDDLSTINGVPPVSQEQEPSTKQDPSIDSQEDTAKISPVKKEPAEPKQLEEKQQPDQEKQDVESVLAENEENEKDNGQSPGKKEAGSDESSIIDSNDPTRWGEIIDALKSGGFGT